MIQQYDNQYDTDDLHILSDMYKDESVYELTLWFNLSKNTINEIIMQCKQLNLFDSVFNAEFLSKEI